MTCFRLIAIILTLATWTAVAPAQTSPSAANSAKTATNKSAKTAEKLPAAALVDVNHATAAELKTLNGIGDAYSLAIIRNRPYKNKTQLRSKGAIPNATYEKIKDQIVAKQ